MRKTDVGTDVGTNTKPDISPGGKGAPAWRKPARAATAPARQRKSGSGVQPGQLSADELRLMADTMPGAGPGDD